MKLEFSAGGVIYQKLKDDFQFLLILDSYDRWTFPKGHIEKDEKPEIAAKREIAEEVGLKNLKIIQKLAKNDYWFKDEKTFIHKYVYFYLMEAPPESTLKAQTEEIKDAKWFSYTEAQKTISYKKNTASILKKAYEILKNKKSWYTELKGNQKEVFFNGKAEISQETAI